MDKHITRKQKSISYLFIYLFIESNNNLLYLLIIILAQQGSGNILEGILMFACLFTYLKYKVHNNLWKLLKNIVIKR